MCKDKNPAAVALGALGGAVGGKKKTQLQTNARKENGKKGGRPIKTKPKGVLRVSMGEKIENPLQALPAHHAVTLALS